METTRYCKICGKPLTIPQKNLVEALEKKYYVETEFVVPTKIKRGLGYPTCYKIDIALPWEMIAIEVDGNSHCSLEIQTQDKKKEDFLRGKGWKVFRFKNEEVTERLSECVERISSTISK